MKLLYRLVTVNQRTVLQILWRDERFYHTPHSFWESTDFSFEPSGRSCFCIGSNDMQISYQHPSDIDEKRVPDGLRRLSENLETEEDAEDINVVLRGGINPDRWQEPGYLDSIDRFKLWDFSVATKHLVYVLFSNGGRYFLQVHYTSDELKEYLSGNPLNVGSIQLRVSSYPELTENYLFLRGFEGSSDWRISMSPFCKGEQLELLKLTLEERIGQLRLPDPSRPYVKGHSSQRFLSDFNKVYSI